MNHVTCMEIVITVQETMKTLGSMQIGYPYFTMLWLSNHNPMMIRPVMACRCLQKHHCILFLHTKNESLTARSCVQHRLASRRLHGIGASDANACRELE
ncbi:MAG TPA: hypothetical protein VE954_01375 [Oligoflexus sp.]|uniref:hypothetical protein n=1 Tax=Oligoflexus sp. TaxID=1971216 RepID=UPI002D3520F2|nr:hypothetical protein [Oligoflexus sp.]HYX31733.1 hypothetical protein [Oligoflexus sp.]